MLKQGTGLYVGQNQVIPLFDQVYAVDVDAFGVVLTRVTDRIPEEIHPGLNTRTIATVAVGADLFREQHALFNNRQDYDEVNVEFNRSIGKAVVHLEPRMSFTPPITKEEEIASRQPLQLEVKKGGLLTARGRSYKVLNVVPPQDIEGVGHLVGWIELAPDAVEPAAQNPPRDPQK
jgi:hypothetical protein